MTNTSSFTVTGSGSSTLLSTNTTSGTTSWTTLSPGTDGACTPTYVYPVCPIAEPHPICAYEGFTHFELCGFWLLGVIMGVVIGRKIFEKT
jgi:hypothetical protein